MGKRVSVVVINLNNQHAIVECITSLVHQNYYDYELIFVDAGSKDNSARVAYSICSSFKATKFYFHADTDHPLAINIARLKGLELSSGEIICFADSDCIYPPNWLSILSSEIQTTSRTAAVFGPRYPDRGDGIGTFVRKLDGYKSRKFNSSSAVTYTDFSANMFFFAGCNLAIRADVLRTISLFDNLFVNTSFEDVDFQIRLLSAGYHVRFTPDACIEHLHPMGVAGLLRKAIKSGSGFGLLVYKYPRIILSKWSPIRDIIKVILFIIAGIALGDLFTSTILFFSLLTLDAIRRLFSKYALKEDTFRLLASIPLKIIYDFTRIIGFSITVAHLLSLALLPILAAKRLNPDLKKYM